MQTISIPPSRHNINNLVVHSCTSSHKLALIRHHEEIEVHSPLNIGELEKILTTHNMETSKQNSFSNGPNNLNQAFENSWAFFWA